ncbi:YdcF family protein [candidate division KSB1 bacterium]|nr:YdcF family protein [candidate division KSB1 bacterium]
MTLGLIHKKECRTLTLRGWILFVAIILIICLGLFCNIHSFLAMNDPLSAEILVVEGWMPDYCMQIANDEFADGNYRLLITTGEPVIYGYYLAEYKSHAEIAAATLVKIGFDSTKLVAVPGEGVVKDRTYASAVALRKWLDISEREVQAINLLSLGAHSRRSRLLFQNALGDEIKVGVIAAENRNYDENGWWRSSHGVRTIISETIAYIYAKLIFRPNEKYKKIKGK